MIISATILIIFSKNGPTIWYTQGPTEIKIPNTEKIQMMFTKVKKPHTFWTIDFSFMNASISTRMFSASFRVTIALPVISYNLSRCG